MAPLPLERCNISLPFQVTGIDFAGPFEIKASPLRKAPIIKGYASVFVCFSTKAIHLEPCSDLSSPAFQAAFSSFVGRRGLPQRVVTDNGRNFVGANRVLELEFSNFVKTAAQDIAQKYISNVFEWKFIPPHAPHMGGLWEADVKSFKFHLKIIMAMPEETYQNMSVVNRWEKLKVIHHQFSLRWKADYLLSLHKRYKWQSPVPNIEKGDLVVVMDDLTPPCEWRLGRVEKTYLGLDQNIRIAYIRTTAGTITRPIAKLCYLPFLSDDKTQ